MSKNKASASKSAEPLPKLKDEPKEKTLQKESESAAETKQAEPEWGESEREMQKSEQEFERLTSLVAEQNDKYLRLAAEYDNFRKRSLKERESIYPEAFAACALAFLPVLDSLERACSQETQDESHKKGIELIKKQFYDALSKAGISEMEALGANFDPGLHNAVQHVEDENLGENVVAEVMQKGFLMGDKVIRHAIVKVAN